MDNSRQCVYLFMRMKVKILQCKMIKQFPKNLNFLFRLYFMRFEELNQQVFLCWCAALSVLLSDSVDV